jgi:hypothetical protein
MGVSVLSEISPRNIRVAIFRKKFDFELSVYSRSSCLMARVEKSKRMPPQITLEENGYFMMNSHLMERGIYIPRPRSRT